MHSIIEWAAQERLPHKLYLFYSNRNPEGTAFIKELEDWAEQNPDFNGNSQFGEKTSDRLPKGGQDEHHEALDGQRLFELLHSGPVIGTTWNIENFNLH